VAHIVAQADEVRARLEQVGQEGQTGGRLRVQQFQQLRDLDDGAGADDTNAKGLADGEFEAVWGSERVDVQD